MRVFIAGATGTIGRPVTRRLLAAGHEVVGLTRTHEGAARLSAFGAIPAIGDALDADDLRRVVKAAKPTHVLHLLTAIPQAGATKPSDLAATNVLRTKGTANLLRAAVAAGAQRIVAESFCFAYGVADLGGEPLPESELPVAPHRNGDIQAIVDALRSLEQQMKDASMSGLIETIVLRYGLIYGPGVPSTESMIESLQRRKLPLIANANGIASFIHIEDAAAATIAALEHGGDGEIYNIVDDNPEAFSDFVTTMAETTGAPAPRSVPRWLARIVAPLAVEMASAKVPLSNMHAKKELSWRPRYRSPREGLTTLAEAR